MKLPQRIKSTLYVVLIPLFMVLMGWDGTSPVKGQKDPRKDGVFLELDGRTPFLLQNEVYGRFLEGVVSLNGGFQFHVADDLFMGMGGHYSQSAVDRDRIAALEDSRLWFGGGYVQASYRPKVGGRVFWEASLKAGFQAIRTKNPACQKDTIQNFQPFRDNAFTLEPQTGLYVEATDGFYVGLLASYNMVFSEFDPAGMCIDAVRYIPEDDKNGIFETWTLGFGASVKL